MNNQIELIEKFEKTHGKKYNYSLFEYKGWRTKIKIICEKHGVFEQNIDKHLKYGCKKCAVDNTRLNSEKFILKSIDKHDLLYDYSLVNYVRNSDKVKIICKTHGEFLQKPNDHLKGHGCSKCSSTEKMGTDNFIKRSKTIHKDQYSYSKVEYKNIDKEVIIICKVHGIFKQTPRCHLNGSCCPKCSNKFGVMENRWLDTNNINIENRQLKICGYTVDGFDPITNTIYEFNGDFWHGNPTKYNLDNINPVVGKTFNYLYQKTLRKEETLKNAGYNLISIWESDFLDI